MKTFLVVLLFALACCNFSSNLKQIAQCLIESQKLRKYLPKLVNAVKTGDYQTLLKEGLSAYQEIKTEVKECYDSEPILRGDDCKHKILPELLYFNYITIFYILQSNLGIFYVLNRFLIKIKMF